MKHDGLALLEARVVNDLARIAHPRAQWMEPQDNPSGNHVFDVIIVGGGQSGLATAFGLMRSEVRNILVLDRAEEGFEGPWVTYARMETLRSPKDFTGPDLDVPSLTYQSWHEASFGSDSWHELGLIPKGYWMDYLAWFRRVTNLPVRNGIDVVDIAEDGSQIAVIAVTNGAQQRLLCRKLVLATGQESMGTWTLPTAIAALPASRRAHSADAINFNSLRGKKVAVIGAGASAFDNAGTALEAGAAELHLLCRRAEAQIIQPYRWLTFRGFLRHLCDLDDSWRWRFMRKVMDMREGFPQATFDRCSRHEGFALHLGAPIVSATDTADGVQLELPDTTIIVDFIIAATGIDINFTARPELAHFASNIATWADRYQPPAHEANARLGKFPYLGDDYALQEREAGATPWINNIHLFSIASTMSFGASGSSINAMTTAVPKLVQGITRGLFQADIERHWNSFQEYNVKQAIIDQSCVVSHVKSQ